MIRRVISIICKGHSEDNNKIVKFKFYNFFQLKYLIWVNSKNYDLDIYFDEYPVGYFLEVDPDYLDQSHELKNGYILGHESWQKNFEWIFWENRNHRR